MDEVGVSGVACDSFVGVGASATDGVKGASGIVGVVALIGVNNSPDGEGTTQAH